MSDLKLPRSGVLLEDILFHLNNGQLEETGERASNFLKADQFVREELHRRIIAIKKKNTHLNKIQNKICQDINKIRVKLDDTKQYIDRDSQNKLKNAQELITTLKTLVNQLKGPPPKFKILFGKHS